MVAGAGRGCEKGSRESSGTCQGSTPVSGAAQGKQGASVKCDPNVPAVPMDDKHCGSAGMHTGKDLHRAGTGQCDADTLVIDA